MIAAILPYIMLISVFWGGVYKVFMIGFTVILALTGNDAGENSLYQPGYRAMDIAIPVMDMVKRYVSPSA